MISKNSINNKNEITVVIPCHYKHLKFMYKLLDEYNKQTFLPLEVIIVVCETRKVKNMEIDILNDKLYKYELKIIKIKEKSAAGNNRYRGTSEAKGDIVVFQDADDLPHKQRLEIVRYFFIKYPDMVHICHQFSYSQVELGRRYSLEDVRYKLLDLDIFIVPRLRIPAKITNGNVAIRKRIYKTLNWYKFKFRGQDVSLNSFIFNKYNRTLLIREPLYYYRKSLSVKNFI